MAQGRRALIPNSSETLKNPRISMGQKTRILYISDTVTVVEGLSFFPSVFFLSKYSLECKVLHMV